MTAADLVADEDLRGRAGSGGGGGDRGHGCGRKEDERAAHDLLLSSMR
jgi:hypothetical protein